MPHCCGVNPNFRHQAHLTDKDGDQYHLSKEGTKNLMLHCIARSQGPLFSTRLRKVKVETMRPEEA